MSSTPFAAELVACRDAQRSWASRPIRERLRAVRKLRQLIVDRVNDIIGAVEADIGRPAVEVVATELLPTAAALKFLEQEATRLLKARTIPGRLKPSWLFFCSDVVYHRPWGIVAIIGTWNYPFYLNVVQIAQALVAGNGVLWKPSENAPRTAELTQKLFRDAGFPADLFAQLSARREVGSQVAEAEVDYVVFTGSDAVGRKLAARLGERLIPSTLELSGCDALFVLEDADVKLAARATWFGVMLNRGQTCIAVRRVFVHESQQKAFTDALLALTRDVKQISLVTEGQAIQAERLVTDAVRGGATLLGGDSEPVDQGRPRLAFSPTFLLNVTPEMLICREASFAPICGVISFNTVDEAVSLAGKCPFALSASIFTASIKVAESLATRLATGSVVVNDVIAPTAHPATPFGGRGASGWGVTQGAEGLLAMTVPQTVTIHRGTFRPHIDEVVSPDPAATLDILRGLMRATHGRGLRAWFGGIRQMIRGIRRKRKNPPPSSRENHLE